MCGLTGQKFESSYYDGSTNELKVVSVPSVESLLMYLNIKGYKNIQIIIDPRSYNSIWKQRGKLAKAVAICALVNQNKNKPNFDEFSWIQDYELGLIKTILDKKFVEPLYKLFHLKKIDLHSPFFIINTLFNMKAGEIFTEENIRSIRPGYGLPPKYLKEILGKRATQDIKKGTPLSWELVR